MTEKEKSDCLSCNPFEGDFGNSSDRILENKIVKGRAEVVCHLCGRKTVPGTSHRTMKAVFDGQFMSFRWCEECCKAMALSWYDDGQQYEKMVNINR